MPPSDRFFCRIRFAACAAASQAHDPASPSRAILSASVMTCLTAMSAPMRPKLFNRTDSDSTEAPEHSDADTAGSVCSSVSPSPRAHVRSEGACNVVVRSTFLDVAEDEGLMGCFRQLRGRTMSDSALVVAFGGEEAYIPGKFSKEHASPLIVSQAPKDDCRVSGIVGQDLRLRKTRVFVLTFGMPLTHDLSTFFMLEHMIPQREQDFLKGSSRALRRGIILLCSTVQGSSRICVMYTPTKNLARLLKAGLKVRVCGSGFCTLGSCDSELRFPKPQTPKLYT